ncbi:ClC family H(+)/Cl(-) exchange transporter [Parabacteroides bouchesdurhonensis]|uniref:ClC family H(+)/Cl(-) exchange transporter n=1 Tax=Parabacteroides bouchesdurhonensis TaxID=1936995 RepID=UPI000E482367|nr:ClC family H(+)/Cl(-) exchange transporter [Parabacteroides bouchesdurhonensis]RHJ95151.1 ClC family H(+)/Cl(-) exchange transporter [Bacteroides sp. AM07-16]
MDWKISDLKKLGKWRILKLKLIDARLYFVSIFVGLLTGMVAVPYRYLLQLFFDSRKAFFDSNPHWYLHLLLFPLLWGVLLFVAWLVKKMPLITGGGIPQTRGVINGRITYKNPLLQLIAKFFGGVMALSAGLSLGREGPCVQIGSYIGNLVSKWGRVLSGERKQLLAAGAGAGLAAAFAAPLASSLLVIESIERFDAPKTAITTLLAGVVAGGVAGFFFPVNPYFKIDAIAPSLPMLEQFKLFLLLAVVISVFAKLYSTFTLWSKQMYPRLKQPVYIKLLYLLIMAYVISLTEINLTGGGEQFLIAQAMDSYKPVLWVTAMMMIHLVFTAFSFSSGLPGGNFIPTLVTGGLFGQVVALLLVSHGFIGQENISYIMLISMVGFLVAVVRTPLTGIVLITEMTGHLDVFYPSIIVGGLTYYFTELLQIKPFNVVLYDEMISMPQYREQQRYSLAVEIMYGSYFDGKLVDKLTLPEHCIIKSVRRDRKSLSTQGLILIPGDQVEIEIDAQDIEKLYEPLVSMANIY